MNLDRISIEARARSPWEAIDLGFIMARQWWKSIFLSWFIPSFTLFVILSVAFPQQSWLAYTVVWWLKPFWDRGPLYIASRRLFGEEVSLKEVLLKLPSLYKIDWFLWLTFRRFSLARSFNMPLTVLEQLKGSDRSARLAVLDRQNSSAPTWLTIAGMHFEAVLLFGILMFAYLLTPETADVNFSDIFEEQGFALMLFYNVLTYLSMSIVGPFYVLAGFSLYVNRRISLEAWDIEIRFRHLASSLSRHSRPIGNTLLGLVLCMCLQFTMPTEAEAADLPITATDIVSDSSQQSTENTATDATIAKTQIMEILSTDEFHQREVVSGWRLKNIDDDSLDESPEWVESFVKFIEDLFDSMSWLAELFINISPYIEYILWGVVITLIILVALYYRRSIHRLVQQAKSQNSEPTAPTAMFGLDLRQESLPDNIPASVRQLWAENNQREAIGLLYRALLSTLIHQHGFAFADGNTEGECAAIVRKRGVDKLSRYMQRLTRCWQQLAYGHLLPEYKQVDALCNEWEVLFSHE